MKNNKQRITGNRPQTGQPTKGQYPHKNAITDSIKNTAQQTTGLNQEKILRDDLFPSDGDNMTQ